MVLTRDVTLQQGDTKKIVIPVFDDDDPNQEYFPGIENVTVEFTIASGTDATSAEWVATSSDISIEAFSNAKLGSDAFDFSDVDVADDHTIPSDQDVIIVEIPETETKDFAGGAELTYQCRFDDTDGNRLTPVTGAITIQASAPFS